MGGRSHHRPPRLPPLPTPLPPHPLPPTLPPLTPPPYPAQLDVVLVISAISLGVDPSMAASGRGHTDRAVGLSPFQAFFSAFFLLEVSLKGLLLPWRQLSRSSLARFDAAISLAAVTISVLVSLPNGFNNGAAVRAVLSLRLFRLLRLLRKVPTPPTPLLAFSSPRPPP